MLKNTFVHVCTDISLYWCWEISIYMHAFMYICISKGVYINTYISNYTFTQVHSVSHLRNQKILNFKQMQHGHTNHLRPSLLRHDCMGGKTAISPVSCETASDKNVSAQTHKRKSFNHNLHRSWPSPNIFCAYHTYIGFGPKQNDSCPFHDCLKFLWLKIA